MDDDVACRRQGKSEGEVDGYAAASGPVLSSATQIEPQWIDYNGHLNMAYYNVMMDRAIDEMWVHLGIGPTYLKERHGSTFTAEAHVRYLREIYLGDPVQISVYLLGHDEKRLHTFEELRHATEGWLSATSENMTLHMDMKQRKGGALPAGHSRAHRGGRGFACGGAAARGHRPQGRDAPRNKAKKYNAIAARSGR